MRAERRFRTVQDGIETWHVLSAGAHYDPEHVAVGPIVGLDDHRVAPGAGFGWHAHRGTHIVSLVLSGTLRHEDSGGAVRVVPAGSVLVQSTGDGIRHTETNASQAEPLRFVQVTILGAAPVSVATPSLPSVVAGVGVDVVSAGDAHRLSLDLGDGRDLVLTPPPTSADA